jgi:hypothetical protein
MTGGRRLVRSGVISRGGRAHHLRHHPHAPDLRLWILSFLPASSLRQPYWALNRRSPRPSGTRQCPPDRSRRNGRSGWQMSGAAGLRSRTGDRRAEQRKWDDGVRPGRPGKRHPREDSLRRRYPRCTGRSVTRVIDQADHRRLMERSDT